MGFGRFWEEVGNFFENLGALLGGALLVFMKAGAEALAVGGGQLLKDAAMAAVRSQEDGGGTGSEKRERAFEAVKGTLVSASIPILVNAVYLAIEHAVAQLNKEKALNALAIPPGA